MTHAARNHVLLLLAGTDRYKADQSDGQLLQRFAHDRDEAAFDALLRRHGGVVWGVCRRCLGHEQDAEDVFQATFLLLAQQAGKIRNPAALASWLHGTAHRLALRAKRDLARRHFHEQRAGRPVASPASPEWDLRELQGVLDVEVERLPAKYREAFTRCVLAGQSKQEIADDLGCDPGTVAVHIFRARKRLQRQLARRGVALSVALALTPTTSGAIPSQLIGAALRAVHSPVTALPERIRELLLHGGTTAMLTTRQKLFGIVLVALGLLAAGARALTPPPGNQAGQASPPERQTRSADSPMAVRDDKPDKPSAFFIRPVKTDLQRELAPMNANVFVLLDATSALADGKIHKEKLNLPELRKALEQYKKADTKLHFTVFHQHDDHEPDRYENADLVRLAMTGFGHWIGFSKVSAWVNSGSVRLDWEKASAAFRGKPGRPDAEERPVTNKLAKAYPVRTELSRFLTAGADCTVVILPSLKNDGGTIPEKVRDAITDAVGKLKIARKKRVSFVLGFVEGEAQQMLINRLSRFAKEIGFEESVVQFR